MLRDIVNAWVASEWVVYATVVLPLPGLLHYFGHIHFSSHFTS